MAKKTYVFFQRMIVWLGVLLLATFTILSFIEQTFVVLDGTEAVQFLQKEVRFFLFLILGALLIWCAFKWIPRVPEKALFVMFALWYVAVGTYLILGTAPVLRADAAYIYDLAMKAKVGNFVGLERGGYFFRNPHQLGFAVYEILFSLISENVRFFYFLNLLWGILIQLVQWLLSKQLFPDKPTVRKVTMIFSFLFLPQLFFVLFLYGQIPGLLCVITAFYFFVRYMREEKKRQLIGLLLFGMLAVMLKQNYQISMLAMAILLFLKWLRKMHQTSKEEKGAFAKEIRHLCAMGLVLIALAIPGPLVKAGFGLASGMEINDGVPNILYVDMGLQDDPNHPGLGGWSNGYIWYRYDDCNYDNDVAFRRSLTSLHASAIRLCESPSYFVKFFYEKIVSTWCDPMFGSVWSGPIAIEGLAYENQEGILRDLYAGEEIYFILADASNVMVFFIYLGGFAFFLKNLWGKKGEGKEEWMYAPLYMLGGFLCHVLWETKSQYVYMYVYLMIPMAVSGLGAMGTYLKKLVTRGKEHETTL
ncbi:MAG: glycosyltransferase family 39 protein [Lachnospiraceae bacterium]|nr:glycosyltransferase family 39 protein [Lachnospiraceae bacterium]